MHEEESEHRFSHLLKPIRDLADNWDIDIAADLEDYLEELEHIKISFDGEDDNGLNFAEAALLIQGSACVYSKKVEFLYNLVFVTLDLLHEKRKKAMLPASVASNGVDVDVDMGAGEEPELEPLDDVMKEDPNISLHDMISPPKTKNNGGKKVTKQQGENLLHQTPLILISLGDLKAAGGHSNSNGLGDNSFNLATCDVDDKGALLLAGSHTALSQLQADKGGINNAGDDGGYDDMGGMNNGSPYKENANYLPGGEIDAMDDDPLAANAATGGPKQGKNLGNKFDSVAEQGENGGKGRRTRGASSKTMEEKDDDDEDADGDGDEDEEEGEGDGDFADPLRLLDHFDVPRDVPAQPFRKGKSYKPISSQTTFGAVLRTASLLPSSSGAAGFFASSSSASASLSNLDGSDSFSGATLLRDSLQFSSEAIASSLTNMAALKSCFHPEFKYLALRETRRLTKLAKNLHPTAANMSWGKPKTPAQRAHRRRGAAAAPADHTEEEQEEVEDQLLAGLGEEGDFNMMEMGGGDDGLMMMEDTGNELIVAAQQKRAPAGDRRHAALPMVLNVDAGNSNNTGEEDPDASVAYADLCRLYTEKYLQESSKYMLETSLSKRVNEWQSKMEPVLRAIEQRTSFDIQEYESSIVDQMKAMSVESEDKAVDFAHVLTEQAVVTDQYQVCRYFLATLQLCNEGVIELRTASAAAGSVAGNFDVVMVADPAVTRAVYPAAGVSKFPQSQPDDDGDDGKSATLANNNTSNNSKNAQTRKKNPDDDDDGYEDEEDEEKERKRKKPAAKTRKPPIHKQAQPPQQTTSTQTTLAASASSASTTRRGTRGGTKRILSEVNK